MHCYVGRIAIWFDKRVRFDQGHDSHLEGRMAVFDLCGIDEFNPNAETL